MPYNLKKANWEAFEKELAQGNTLLEANLLVVENKDQKIALLENSRELERDLERIATSLTTLI